MTRSRGLIISVLIISLVAAGLARELASWSRDYAEGRTGESPLPVAQRSSLAGMDSFALALLLGGLRGPLVMFLWTSSEAQKGERELEDFDTKVEWIRLLQPEFDSVHLFQVWNKAYNISVQMASLANKYVTILDALDYAESVDRQRPDNISIAAVIAHVYFDKLGNSQEKHYFRRRVREETQWDPVRWELIRTDPNERRMRMPPMLDEDGNILPEYLTPRRQRPANLPEDAEWNDGSELQYLAEFQPFPYGISTFALGYNYYKRAQVLQTVTGQRHAQDSPRIVDSRPGLALRFWAEEERERSRRFELQLFGIPLPTEPFGREHLGMELPTAQLTLDEPFVNPDPLDEAIYGYERAAELAAAAIVEYNRHLRIWEESFNLYRLHITTMEGLQAMSLADHAYLSAMNNPEADREALLATAAEQYSQARDIYHFIILRHFVEDWIVREVYPEGFTRVNIEDLPPEEYPALLEATRRRITDHDYHGADRQEFELYIERASQRLAQIQNALARTE